MVIKMVIVDRRGEGGCCDVMPLAGTMLEIHFVLIMRLHDFEFGGLLRLHNAESIFMSHVFK